MYKDTMLRVMSFNIRNDNDGDKGLSSWKVRKDKVASVIRFHHTDIVGLQEVLKDQLEYLDSHLSEYDFIGVGRDDGEDAGEFVPIFYRKDRITLEDWGAFWLSETPEVKGSMGWDAACVRVTTWGKFKDRRTNQIFFFFNTHFDHMGQVAMEKSAYLLLEKVEEIAADLPAIIVGDFNNTPDSKAYRILTNSHGNALKDSKLVSKNGHYGCEFSFHGFDALELLKRVQRGSIDSVSQLIDFIFIKNEIDVINHAILADNWDGVFPSDHMPVVADLKVDE